MKIKSFIIYSTLFVFLIVILIPLFEYSHNVGFPSGNKNTDWANFGDFLGGTIGTIVSLFSLIILAYLTFVLSKSSNEENKKVSILLKRLESYDKISSHLPILLQTTGDLANISEFLNHYLTVGDEKKYDENIQLFAEKSKHFDRLFSTIVTFDLLYGHLYSYSFNSPEYNKLIDQTNRLKHIYNMISNDLILKDKQSTRIDEVLINDFNTNFYSILKNLKTELK